MSKQISKDSEEKTVDTRPPLPPSVMQWFADMAEKHPGLFGLQRLQGMQKAEK